MPIRYYKLFDYLNRYGMKKTDLISKADISAPTLAKLSKGDSINTNIIDKICAALGVQPSDIMEYVSIDCNYKIGDVFRNTSLFSEKEIEIHNNRVKNRIKRLTENLSKETSTDNESNEITEQMLKEIVLKLSSYDFIDEESYSVVVGITNGIIYSCPLTTKDNIDSDNKTPLKSRRYIKITSQIDDYNFVDMRLFKTTELELFNEKNIPIIFSLNDEESKQIEEISKRFMPYK